MKLTLRSRIYLGVLPLLLLFLGIMSYLILNVQGLYRDTQEISSSNLRVGQGLSEIQTTLSSMELLLDGGTGYRARERDKVTLNRLSALIQKNTGAIEYSAFKEKLGELVFEIGNYDLNLKTIGDLSNQLLDGEGDPKELYEVVRETNEWTGQLRMSLDELLQQTQQHIEEQADTVYIVVIGGMIVAIVLTLAISTFLWRRIICPIEAMSEGMEEFAAESGQLEIDYDKDDELGYLARSLEGMTARLKEYQNLTNEKLVRSTSALRSILELSPDAFLIFSERLKPLYFSKSASNLYQKSTFKDKLPLDVRRQLKATLDSNRAQISKEINEAIRISVGGEERWYLLHTFPFDAPDVEDFTYKSDTSEHSIAAIFQEVTLLKLSDSLRKNLLATVSHELKTPITSARMSLYLLLEQQLGSLNEDQIELVETARDDVNRQLATIEHLLDLSRVEEDTNVLNRSEFALCDLVAQAIQSHQEIGESYEVGLSCSPFEHPFMLQADKEKIRIVLNNFLVNAIKYSDAGGQVEVCVSASGDYCRVEVIDQGAGMDETTVQKIFDPLALKNESGAIKGTGLGLKVSKDIIDAHDGQIGCSSKLGEGSRFFFEIPLRKT